VKHSNKSIILGMFSSPNYDELARRTRSAKYREFSKWHYAQNGDYWNDGWGLCENIVFAIQTAQHIHFDLTDFEADYDLVANRKSMSVTRREFRLVITTKWNDVTFYKDGVHIPKHVIKTQYIPKLPKEIPWL